RSRYEGLSSRRAPIAARSDKTRWRRLMVEYRPLEKLSPPNLVMFIPLTSTAGSGEASCQRLLGVVAEPWFEIAGFGEWFEARVCERREAPNLPMIGHDPTLKVDLLAPVSLSVTGPIGHTFDTDTDEPLFVSSSFIISPPEKVDLSWAM